MLQESNVVSPATKVEMAEGDRRDISRRAVLWPAKVYIGKHEFNSQIRNFSLGGLKLKLDLPLKEGTLIGVKIPKRNITLKAEISWQDGDYMGLSFHENDALIEDIFGERATNMGAAKTLLKRSYREK